jgi:hypothetical protein
LSFTTPLSAAAAGKAKQNAATRTIKRVKNRFIINPPSCESE